jgi:hypothetical protein
MSRMLPMNLKSPVLTSDTPPRLEFPSMSNWTHEMVHVVQWRMLGPEMFLAQYADGLECSGYSHRARAASLERA